MAKFQAAYQIVPSPKVLFNMGLAHQALGNTVEALECFEGFLGELPDAPEDARAYAERQVALLRANVSFVEISANLPGSEARIDEQWVGAMPLKKAVIVQPGPHVVSIRANGYEVFRQPLVAGGELRDVVLRVLRPLLRLQQRRLVLSLHLHDGQHERRVLRSALCELLRSRRLAGLPATVNGWKLLVAPISGQSRRSVFAGSPLSRVARSPTDGPPR